MVGAFLFYLITGYPLARLRLVLVGPGGFLNALLRPLSARSLDHTAMPPCAVVVGKVLPLASRNVVSRVKMVTPFGGGTCSGLCGAAFAFVLRLCCVSFACMLGGSCTRAHAFWCCFLWFGSRSVGLVLFVFLSFFSLVFSALSSFLSFFLRLLSSFSLFLSFLPQLIQ